MKESVFGNWWLKLLALILALVVYYALKEDTLRFTSNHERTQETNR